MRSHQGKLLFPTGDGNNSTEASTSFLLLFSTDFSVNGSNSLLANVSNEIHFSLRLKIMLSL